MNNIKTIMQNGAIVLSEWKWRDRHLVACEWGENNFVTWSIIQHSTDEGKMSGYSGHYFSSEDSALKDLTQRINSVIGGFPDERP